MLRHDAQLPVHILGAGGIGVALAVSLARGGVQVVLVDVDEAKVTAGRARGVAVAGQPPVAVSMVPFESWEAPTAGAVLLCTKTYDNPQVLRRLRPGASLVPVQNGYDPLLEERDHAAEGIASFVSECARDRPETRITRPGHLHLGARRAAAASEREAIAALAAALARGKLFSVELVEDVRPYKATKLMYNAAISPLAAAAGVDNGKLLSDRRARALFFALIRENYGILRHAGVPLARIGPFHPDNVARILRTPLLPVLLAAFFRPSLRGTYCSMAPDIGAGRTEIEAYNGHLIRLARERPCPLNRAAHGMITDIVERRLAPDRKHLERVAEALFGARA